MQTVVCEELEKRFGEVKALRNISLQIAAGEIVVLLGPSGCGKTTLLRLLAGFERPDQGQIFIGGQLVANPTQSLAPEKRNIGMVFQHHALFPHLSVAQNIAFGLRGSSQERLERVHELLQLIELVGYGERMPHQLSGGQQQRVALARALAPRPSLLLLDEPFSSLDAELRVSMREQLREILKQVGTTALFVTHDREEAFSLGDRIAVMRAGLIEQFASPEALFLNPNNRFVAEFVGLASFLPARWHDGQLRTSLGALQQAASSFSDAPIDVLVRPDDLHLSPERQGASNATVLQRRFQGGEFLYKVQLDSGQQLSCLANHSQHFAEGARVWVALEPDHALATFPAESMM
jgi:iron(III) transport system ATP-binding protein